MTALVNVSEINPTEGLCCTVCDCTCFLLPSNGTLVTEWLRSVTETLGPLVCATQCREQAAVSVMLPKYLLDLQFPDGRVGCSL